VALGEASRDNVITAWAQDNWRRHGWRPLIIGVRCALAALAAVKVSRLLGLQFPIYALIAAIMVTEYHGHETRQQSVTRFMGNVLGITAGGILGTFCGGHAWVIGMATFIMVVFCYSFDFAIAAKYSAFVAALTVMDHSTRPWLYGWDRIAETLIGIGFAVLMSLVIPVPKPKTTGSSSSPAPE
jgi:uncharacterized membrane protein YgaE (UPF0421/DUF939 family)